MERWMRDVMAFIGADGGPVSHTEKLVSAGGGFLGIFLVYLISSEFTDAGGASWIVASMGASAVLLFAVPHGPLSQPWAVIGGHFVSAVLGVTIAQWVPDPLIGGALAVSIAIGAMHYLRCIHPPGGATALTAVLGGSSVHALGYEYVITPVMFNVLVILATAFIVNYFFAWRRYPARLSHKEAKTFPGAADLDSGHLSHADLSFALGQLNSFVDVSEDDLERIFELAYAHHRGSGLDPVTLRAGRCYSNGEFGDRWEVRRIRSVSGSRVDYHVVAGRGRRRTGHSSRAAFARWGSYEVVRQENTWHRMSDDLKAADALPAFAGYGG